MRILWLSNSPMANTGYGSQTRLFTPRIRDLGHDVEIVAFYGAEGSPGEWNGMRVWPKGFSSFGTDVAQELVRREDFDLLISLVDAWPLPGAALAEAVPWAPWFPSDAEPLAKAIQAQVEHAQFPMVFTNFARRQCEDVGISPYYVPHGFDSTIYQPSDDRLEYRTETLDVPDDAFLVGIVAANKGRPPRKSWHEQLDAVARLMRKRDDVWLYLHTHLGTQMQGVPLETLIEQYGLDTKRVKACDQFLNIVGGYTDVEMARIYNSLDLLMNVSTGEGFGLTVLEAQACGTPVLVGKWTAMAEVAQPHGTYLVLVDDADPIVIETGAVQFRPHTEAIAEVLEAAYHDREAAGAEDRQQIADSVAHYDAEHVTEKHWGPVLNLIEQKLGEAPSVEVGPIAPHEEGS